MTDFISKGNLCESDCSVFSNHFFKKIGNYIPSGTTNRASLRSLIILPEINNSSILRFSSCSDIVSLKTPYLR